MSFGKGASAGFGGAIGVMAAIAIIFVILPSMACFGAIVLMYAMQPPMQIQNPEKPNASDTEQDDSKEPDGDDIHKSASDESQSISTLWRSCHQGHDLNHTLASRFLRYALVAGIRNTDIEPCHFLSAPNHIWLGSR